MCICGLFCDSGAGDSIAKPIIIKCDTFTLVLLIIRYISALFLFKHNVLYCIAVEGLKKYVGYVTKPFESATPATHVLVFIVRGVFSPWKQTIAHYFTANSTPGNLLWKV